MKTMNNLKEQILQLLRQRGPLVPNDMKKVLGGDSMILGAVLSELVSRGMVKLTKLKKGASPFYYLPSQENLLEKLVEFLNPKDQNTVRLLQEEKVIQESAYNMLTRVSLRNIPDFVREFMVQTKEGPYRFWRYYLISESQAMKLLKERFNPKPPEIKQAIKEEHSSKSSLNTSSDNSSVSSSKNVIDKKIINQESNLTKQSKQKEKTISSENKDIKTKRISEEQKELSIQASLQKTPFYELVIKYFKTNKIELEFEEQISKDREYVFIVKIPSTVGNLKMLCLARNKKKLTQGDVAPALLKAKMKDLPCLFLTNGSFTKKSLDLMNKEYSGLIIKNI